MVQSIDEQLDTITQDVADTYTALGAKGATLPAKKGTSNLKATVDSLPKSKSGFPFTYCKVSSDGVLSLDTANFDSDTFKGVKVIDKSVFNRLNSNLFNKDETLVFDDIIEVRDESFYMCMYSEVPFNVKITNTSFKKLTTVGKSSFYRCGLTWEGNFTFDSLSSVGVQAFYEAFSKSSNTTTIAFPILTSLERGSFERAFYKSQVKSVSFQKLRDTSSDGFKNTFLDSSLEEINLPELESAYLNNTFYNSKLTVFNAPKLKTLYLENTFFRSSIKDFSSDSLTDLVMQYQGRDFYDCTALTTFSVPNVKKLYLHYTFYNCTSLSNIDVSGVVDFNGDSSAFYKCTALTTFSLPSATKIKLTTSTFSGCTALTEIHFRADMQATVEALSGYASKWGATNATIYFDL